MGQQESSMYIGNEKAWEGKFPSCNNCFPRDVQSQLPCLPQCVFTEKGAGAPGIVKKMFQNKTPPEDQPAFIIAYGPSGSGKSRILDFVPEYKHVNTVEVNVDKIFQSNPEFARQMEEIKSRNPDPLYQQRLYFYYRWVADQISDGILDRALLQRLNVLWETTGERIGWIESELARINCTGYKTVLVFPLVSSENLQKRVTERAIREKQIPASKEDIARQANAAQENLVAFLRKHKCPDWVVENVQCKIHDCNPKRVIIIDNDTPNAQVVYDSENLGDKDQQTRFRTAVKTLSQNEAFRDYFANLSPEQ